MRLQVLSMGTLQIRGGGIEAGGRGRFQGPPPCVWNPAYCQVSHIQSFDICHTDFLFRASVYEHVSSSSGVLCIYQQLGGSSFSNSLAHMVIWILATVLVNGDLYIHVLYTWKLSDSLIDGNTLYQLTSMPSHYLRSWKKSGSSWDSNPGPSEIFMYMYKEISVVEI